MTTSVEAATDLYNQLKPEARGIAIEFVMARTPADLQEDMLAVIGSDLSEIVPVPDPTVATVANGATIILQDAANVVQPNSPAVAVVSNGTLVHATYTAPSSGPGTGEVIVANGASVPVVDAGSIQIAGSPGTAVVAGGILSNVRLSI